MSCFEVAVARFQLTMYHLAVVLSRFEAETLRVPPLLRFFTAGAEPYELHLQAFMFIVAPLHAFFTMPLLDKLSGKREPMSWCGHLRHCLEWYFFYLTLFWTVIFIVRYSTTQDFMTLMLSQTRV